MKTPACRTSHESGAETSSYNFDLHLVILVFLTLTLTLRLDPWPWFCDLGCCDLDLGPLFLIIGWKWRAHIFDLVTLTFELEPRDIDLGPLFLIPGWKRELSPIWPGWPWPLTYDIAEFEVRRSNSLASRAQMDTQTHTLDREQYLFRWHGR